MLLSLGCVLLTAWGGWRAWMQARELRTQTAAVHRAEALLAEAARYRDRRRQLAAAQTLSEDAVALGTQTVRAVHEGIAAIPFAVLDTIPGVRHPARAVRAVHDTIAGGIYDTISAVNRGIGQGLREQIKPDSPDKNTKPKP